MTHLDKLQSPKASGLKSKSSALLLLILAAALWSSSGIVLKYIDWSPIAIASGRGLFAGLTMAFLLRRGFRLKALSRGHYLAAACLAILSFTFISAMKLTTAANAVVLQYTAPLWVALLAPFLLSEKIKKSDWLFVAVMFLGIALFFLDDLTVSGLYGIILALISGFFFGLQAIVLRSIKSSSPGLALILGNFLTFILGLWAWQAPWPPTSHCLLIVALGVFQMGLPYFLVALAVPRVSSLDLVLVPMLEPLLCPLWVVIFYGERPGPMALIGASAVITAIIVRGLLAIKSRHILTQK
ncbi:MAG: DMT family transporter [Deltaproteobacteria bacterium]|nr:DMT family transporter [Deltaproteobacteria bacterium]